MENKLESIEIYPKIVVYKNTFKDIDKTFSELKNAVGAIDELFSEWTQWSHFGEYLNPTFRNYPHNITVESLENIQTKTEKQETQRLAILELLNNFYLVTRDYATRNGVDIDEDRTVVNHYGEKMREWKVVGPSIARYRTDISDPVAMTYHSDYIREPINSPGHKFAITALAYFNDDYEGGEIDFIVGGEAYKYKPEAGDFVVFPSGHPEMIMQEKHIYLHGVMPAVGPSKYLSRMYWTKYSQGDQEWFDKEEEFGKDAWAEMYKEIHNEFRKANPNKSSAEKERRIK